MNKLLILRGIPGSGKSTFARNFIKDNSKEWVIVNRDSIRDMLGDYWVPSREKLITCIEDDMVDAAICKGYNVILDATNIVKNKARARFEYLGCEIEFKDFDIDLETAIERDKNRDRTVGAGIITNFYKRYENNIK